MIMNESNSNEERDSEKRQNQQNLGGEEEAMEILMTFMSNVSKR
jgi:hypothetical protein